MPELPERKRSRDGERRPTPRPFAAMAVNAMGAGLSWCDLRQMKYTHLMQLLYEYEDMHSDADGGEEPPSNDAAGLLSL